MGSSNLRQLSPVKSNMATLPVDQKSFFTLTLYWSVFEPMNVLYYFYRIISLEITVQFRITLYKPNCMNSWTRSLTIEVCKYLFLGRLKNNFNLIIRKIIFHLCTLKHDYFFFPIYNINMAHFDICQHSCIYKFINNVLRV